MTDDGLGEGPDGWAVVHHARKLRPDLPVICFSGHSGADWKTEGVPNSASCKSRYWRRRSRAVKSPIAEQA